MWLDTLFVGDATGRWLCIAAGIPVLAGVALLLGPGVLFSREMTWDLLFNLAGAWHIQSGSVPHVDFHDPLGPVVFQLTRVGFWFVGPRPLAVAIGELPVLAFTFAASVLVAKRRLSPIPALVFVVYVALLVLMPANVGDHSRAYSFAMSYNRWGWSALTTLFLLLFVAPGREPSSARADAALGGLLVVFLLYLKITFAVAGLLGVAFALLVVDHVHAAWRTWLSVIGLVLVTAAGPYNRAYFADVRHAASSGYLRVFVPGQLVTFAMNNRAEFALYGSSLLLLLWLWRRGWAPFQTVLAAIAVVSLGGFALSQNSQTANVPVGVVITFLVYNALRRVRELRTFRSADRLALLAAVLMWPLLSVAAEAVTLVGYCYTATRGAGVSRVESTNLRGLAVPADDSALADALAQTGHRLFSTLHPSPQRSPLSAFEYVQTLMEAASAFDEGRRGEARVLVLDQVNPMPFLLGYPPPRGGNLWLWLETPPRAADEVFGDVDVVLVPKYSTDAQSTIFALTEYRDYLDRTFTNREETLSWSILSREPGRALPRR